jgi:hypothetical protein
MRFHLTPHLFSPYSLVMNEYGFFTHEAGSYQERVHHIQLAYASYAALLALFEITSLLGVEGLNFPQFTAGDLTAHNAVAPMPIPAELNPEPQSVSRVKRRSGSPLTS